LEIEAGENVHHFHHPHQFPGHFRSKIKQGCPCFTPDFAKSSSFLFNDFMLITPY
jgi:hypothetical protein